jgi:hypothetical protein
MQHQVITLIVCSTKSFVLSRQVLAPVTVQLAVEWKGLAGGLSVPLILALATASWVWVRPQGVVVMMMMMMMMIVVVVMYGGGGDADTSLTLPSNEKLLQENPRCLPTSLVLCIFPGSPRDEGDRAQELRKRPPRLVIFL